MELSSDKKVFIYWGDGVAPLISANGIPYAHHYVVCRGTMGDSSDSSMIGRTHAEAFLDTNVSPARIYHYVVYAAIDAEESQTSRIAEFSVTTKPRPPADLSPPSTPAGFKATGKPKTVEWEWGGSIKEDQSKMMGYLVEASGIGVSDGGASGFVWDSGATQKWVQPAVTGVRYLYRMYAIDEDLNVSDPSELATGYTIDDYFVQRCIYYEPHIPVYPADTEAWRLYIRMPTPVVAYRLYRIGSEDVLIGGGHFPRGNISSHPWYHNHMEWNLKNYLGDMPNTITLTNVQEDDFVTIMEVKFTAATSTTISAHKFSCSGTDAQTAAALASCIIDPTYGVGSGSYYSNDRPGYNAVASGNVVTLSVQKDAYFISILHPQNENIFIDSINVLGDYRLEVDWPEYSVGTNVVFSIDEHTSEHHFTVTDAYVPDIVSDGHDGEVFGVVAAVRPEYWDDEWGDWREDYHDTPQWPYIHYPYPAGALTCNCGANIAILSGRLFGEPYQDGITGPYDIDMNNSARYSSDYFGIGAASNTEHCPIHPNLLIEYDWARQPPDEHWNENYLCMGWSQFSNNADYTWNPNCQPTPYVEGGNVNAASNIGHWSMKILTGPDYGNYYDPHEVGVGITLVAHNGSGYVAASQHLLIANISVKQVA